MLTFFAVVAVGITAFGQTSNSFVLKCGRQKIDPTSKLTVKFISVLEDSRCPEGAQCIWAGKAKIKVEVTSKRLGTKTFEFNTTMGPQGDRFDGWAINLDSLTPVPTVNGKPDDTDYKATFTIQRLTR